MKEIRKYKKDTKYCELCGELKKKCNLLKNILYIMPYTCFLEDKDIDNKVRKYVPNVNHMITYAKIVIWKNMSETEKEKYYNISDTKIKNILTIKTNNRNYCYKKHKVLVNLRQHYIDLFTPAID